MKIFLLIWNFPQIRAEFSNFSEIQKVQIILGEGAGGVVKKIIDFLIFLWHYF